MIKKQDKIENGEVVCKSSYRKKYIPDDKYQHDGKKWGNFKLNKGKEYKEYLKDEERKTRKIKRINKKLAEETIEKVHAEREARGEKVVYHSGQWYDYD